MRPIPWQDGAGVRFLEFIHELNQLLKQSEDLPTLPDVVFELHAALDSDTTSEAEIARIIERDPALTTRLLRVANSAFFSGGSNVATIQTAIQRLGLRQVRATCIVLAVVKAFSGRGLDHRAFWTHSAAVGMTAQLLQRRTKKANGVSADDLYIAGLLHDIGLLLLDQFFQERFQETAEVQELSSDPLWKSEDLVLGMDHGEIGGLLLGRWSLPRSTIEIVAGHHHPDTVPEEHLGACQLVHTAEAVCTSIGWGCRRRGSGRCRCQRGTGDARPSRGRCRRDDGRDQCAA